MTAPNTPPAKVPVNLSSLFAPVLKSGLQYDWLIDGVPFLLWPTEDDPYIRDIEEDVKDQFDSSREPGEQSFGYWWLRSQSSFHGGAGQKFLDTDDPQVSRIRYLSSRGVNPFEPGEVTVNEKLLRFEGNFRRIELVTWSGVPRLAAIRADNNQVNVYQTPNLTGVQVITVGSSGTCQALTSDGERLYVAVNDRVYRVLPDGSVSQVGTFTLPFSGAVVLAYAKQRLILTIGPRVYEVDPSGVLAPTLIYTNPAPGWAYTAVADGPNGIYLAGFSGPLSELSLMTVTSSGSSVVLGPPIVQLRTPPSEVINGVVFYLNAYFGLATSNGMRIGQFTPYGQPQYGPLLNPGNATFAVAGSGSLMYFSGVDSVWAVDLGSQVATGRFAYCLQQDRLQNGDTTDRVTDIAVRVINGRDHLFGVFASGDLIYDTASTNPANAELTTSWARFATTEPKRMHYLRVEGTFPVPEGGALPSFVRIESTSGQTQQFDIAGGGPAYEFAVNKLNPAEAYRLAFGFSDPATVLRSWQMKARPSPVQFQELALPLGCYDQEVAADGQTIGYPGFANARLAALEEAAQANRVVSAVDRRNGVRYQAQIRRVQFRQTVHLGRTGRNGGLVTLVLRVV